MDKTVYGAIELGGTKINCLVANSLDNILASIQFPTETPEKALAKIAEFFKPYSPLKSIGVGSFGPINLDKTSDNYGSILATPKAHWSGVKIFSILKEMFNCEINIDTDVNAAGLAEQQLGAGKGLKSIVYTTVGTGIGSGIILNGKSMHGLSHPEVGHIELQQFEEDKGYLSCCPFHSYCAEGMASGTAIKKRWGFSLENLETSHPAVQLEAKYLAKYARHLILSYFPEKLIFGGGVSSELLLNEVRNKLHLDISGYLSQFSDREFLDNYLVLPNLGNDAGPMGSLILAINVFD